MMIINISAMIDPESLIEAGDKAGLSPEAVDYFRHFEEVPLELYVDAENGAVCGCKVLINFDAPRLGEWSWSGAFKNKSEIEMLTDSINRLQASFASYIKATGQEITREKR